VLSDSADAKFRKSLLTKSKDWAYEQEYRVVFPSENEGMRHHVTPSVFVSITFGAKISESDRCKVIETTCLRLSHVRFEQARLGRRTFSVDFDVHKLTN
jgi:hypothetical protein